MLTETHITGLDANLKASVEKHGPWNYNWPTTLPVTDFIHVPPNYLPAGFHGIDAESLDGLPWYKICKPVRRPEDPAIGKMREKLRQQQRDEMTPPCISVRSAKPSGSFSESQGNAVSTHGARTNSESSRMQAWYPRRIQSNRTLEHGPPKSLQVHDIATPPAQQDLKRNADQSQSGHKRRKIVADGFKSSLSWSSDHIQEHNQYLVQSIETAAPRKLGTLARDIGQEVRRRAKTSAIKKKMGTAVPCIHSADPYEVASTANEGPERVEMVNAVPKTESKSPKKSAGKILRNPCVVIYRDAGIQMPKAELLSNGHDLGGNTGQDRRRTNAPLPRTRKEKKLREKKDYQPSLNIKGRVSKLSTSNPGRKRSRKTTLDPSRKTDPRWTRSQVDSHHRKHMALNKKSKPVPVLSATRDVKLVDHEDHLVHGGDRSIFG